jgi:hypothetical protein
LIGATHPDRYGKALGGLFQFFPDEPRPIKCAIIDAESTKSRWESAITRRLQLEDLARFDKPGIRYINPSKLGLDSQKFRTKNSQYLAEALAHDSREFVLIDTLAMMWKPTNLVDPEWVFAGLAPFREACQSYGITVVALSHTPRPGQPGSRPFGPIGTSFQENQADAQLIISRLAKNKSLGIRLCHRKSRRSFWIQQDSYVDLGFDGKQGYAPVGNRANEWPMYWSESQRIEPIFQTPFAQVERAVRAAGTCGTTAALIASELDISGRAVRGHLNALAADKIIVKVNNGRNTAWKVSS